MQSKFTIGVKIVLLILPIFLFLFLHSNGYRFRPTYAVDAALKDNGNSIMIGTVDRSWGKVYLRETESEFKTAISVKFWRIWSCPSITSLDKETIKNDPIKTVGWISFKKSNYKRITVLAVKTTDKNVRYIEAGSGSDKQRKEVGLNEIVVFSWDKEISLSGLKAVAYDKNDIQVYKYEDDSEKADENYRWYSTKKK